MMAVYDYIAMDENGSRFSGTYHDVDSVAVLTKELNKMGYEPIKAKRRKAQTDKTGKIKQADVVVFAYKFAEMWSAGLPIIECHEALEEQAETRVFKHIITDIKQSIQKGCTLKSSFEKHGKVFSNFFIGMLEAGETTGELGKTLDMSATYLEKQLDLKHKVKSAFVYPAVVGGTCLVVVTFLLIFVVPVFSKMYDQMRVSLPISTQTLVSLSILIRNWWWALLPVIAIVVWLLRVFLARPYLKAKWDVFKLNVPVFAKLNRMIVASHFIRTFAIQISTGIPLVKAFDVANEVVHNAKFSEITTQLQHSVKAGNTVAKSLKNHDIFPPTLIHMAAAGEEAGRLGEMLNKGVDFLDKDIERTTNALVTKIEPALTIIMGIIVGFILIGIYLPMFDYMAHFK